MDRQEHDGPPVPLHASPAEQRRLGIVVLLVLSAGAAWVLWRFPWPFASGIIIAVIFATVYGHVVVAIVEGTLSGLAWWILGLPAPVLWGTVMLLFSLLPAVGPPAIWGPAAIVLALQGDVWRAAALVAAGGLLVGTVDNVLRPRLVSGRAQLHPLVGFFSVLGGILLFGLTGLFLGPIVWVAAQTLLEVTRMVLDPRNPPERA